MTKKNLWPLTRTDKLNALLSSAAGIRRFQVNYPWEYLDLLEKNLPKIKRKIAKDVQISKHAVVEGNVILGSGVKIFEGAKVRGPAYIGKNTIIGNGSLVRESIIGDDCVVGYCTEIARSLIGAFSWFHTNYVGVEDGV